MVITRPVLGTPFSRPMISSQAGLSLETPKSTKWEGHRLGQNSREPSSALLQEADLPCITSWIPGAQHLQRSLACEGRWIRGLSGPARLLPKSKEDTVQHRGTHRGAEASSVVGSGELSLPFLPTSPLWLRSASVSYAERQNDDWFSNSVAC